MPISKQQICFNLSVKRKKSLPITIQITDIIENHIPLAEVRNDPSVDIYCYLALIMHMHSSASGYGEQSPVWRGSQVTVSDRV